jgi:DNA invertase Pin-like site-specific DNA recombinase
VAEKLTPTQWLEIRELFIQGVSVSQISRDFDIARTSIKARAKKQNWVKLSPEEIEGGHTS